MEEKTNINEENILDKEEQTEETVNDNPAAGQQQEEETQAAGTEEKKAEEKDPLTLANEKIAELEDKYLRNVAEFDNYRKRVLKEKAELILNGGARVVEAVLPVLDDMERAIANGEKTDDPQVLREGMELIHAKFVKTLEGQGVKKIETENADFDTDVHEAVAMVPGMGDDKKGKVIDCIQAGYKINDKVIRHAKVAVGQ
ncbi:MAG: nucleotide exchange factor GrpE [Prevotella sp.]|nr:nucleotide exchange factor GrpE [Prevotella sp.]MDO4934544.1 nucleotide exchange factor GrpE [Prevotella sp.]